MISQQTPIKPVPDPDPNGELDCVPTCLLAALMYLLGIKAMNAEWSPDALKNAVYGDVYTGGTAASAYVTFCAQHGVQLAPMNGNPGQLVAAIHAQLAQDHPCLITIPDPYVPSSYGWTHVLVAFADTSNMITFLDPWPGKPTTKSDQEWQQLLQFNQIWILEKKGDEDVIIDLTMPVIATHFEAVPGNANAWRAKATGKVIRDGMLDYYRSNGAKPSCGFSTLGLPKSDELPLVGQATRQFFERGVLTYDPENRYGKPEGLGDVYPLQLYDNGPGTDPAINTLQAEIAKLQASGGDPAQVAVLQSKIAAAQKALA